MFCYLANISINWKKMNVHIYNQNFFFPFSNVYKQQRDQNHYVNNFMLKDTHVQNWCKECLQLNWRWRKTYISWHVTETETYTNIYYVEMKYESAICEDYLCCPYWTRILPAVTRQKQASFLQNQRHAFSIMSFLISSTPHGNFIMSKPMFQRTFEHQKSLVDSNGVAVLRLHKNLF